MVGYAQIVLVRVMMVVAKGGPAARLAPTTVFTVGRKAPRFADKAERGERSQPFEPLRRVGNKGLFSFVWTHQHVAPLAAVFDHSADTRASTLICRMQTRPPTQQHPSRGRQVICLPLKRGVQQRFQR